MPERPVRIAVVDSGVQPDHPHILAGQLDPGIGVARDGTLLEGATPDRLGHGTAVTAAIQQWAPQARCVTVRVFDEALRASPRALVAAIDWCVAAGVDLVNLSLGTTHAAHGPVFAAAAARAVQAGVVLVAARDVDGTPCFPGALPQAIGVGLDWDCPRESYRVATGEGEGEGEGERRGERGGEAGFLASGHPRPIPGVPQRRNLYGVSFAVANLTGFAAAALADRPDLPQGRERLVALRALLAAGPAGAVAMSGDQTVANAATRSIIQKLPSAPTA
ncbi:subtilisin-like serine protease QhpE [Novosphingobium album (ex Liu et al. 2023)]|uniref:S8 family serine peptidase n=1 Tax=Novosphingobium album (ex Liu et al. 2023) TaxID=3031130 RepID=A0ABT5WUM6_9SPHN|nr:S8 family serine peptidase [Novosphingobium album (ex Liu et al. 2023)]MDE8653576.1 S8 family serine peptidase [Novosphingobium album (ex Liu et al. 2023)]